MPTACPAHCIDIVAAESPWPDRQKYPQFFNIDELRCIYCGMCEEACPVEAIELTSFYDLSGKSREEMIFDKEKLLSIYDQTKDRTDERNRGVHCLRVPRNTRTSYRAPHPAAPMTNPRHIIPLPRCWAAGLWLMLPRGAARGRLLGMLLTAAALGLGAGAIATRWAIGPPKASFPRLAGVTVVAALATITFRNPIYCAIWFGMTLTGVSGLFLFIGAEFLAVATLVVYAGAILVTFLFVLMLAQPEGDAACDRRSWEAMLSAATGAALVGILTMTLCEALARAGRKGPSRRPRRARRETRPRPSFRRSTSPTSARELFGRH